MFEPGNIESFRFLDRHYSPESGEVRLTYQLGELPPLQEKIYLPAIKDPIDTALQGALNNALAILHLVAGISYYKAAVPKNIEFSCEPPGDELATFLETLYTQGLGEFAWNNKLHLEGHINFHSNKPGTATPEKLELEPHYLVPLGGGKDSLVALETLKQCGRKIITCSVGQSPVIAETALVAGVNHLQIPRKMDSQLFEYNRQGAWNGHIPITAINSAILLMLALGQGLKYIAFANEKSASIGNFVTPDGQEVNHQYSKSLAFETQFRELIAREISPDLVYFSLLRPWSELAIVKTFSGLSQYHRHFSSCNRNFHLDGRHIEKLWCCNCPKCRFSFLCLALFMSKDELLDIFSCNLLEDETQIPAYLELLGIGHHKPFECVGEVEESRAAVLQLATQGEFTNALVIRKLIETGIPENPSLETLLKPSTEHHIPAELGACCGLE